MPGLLTGDRQDWHRGLQQCKVDRVRHRLVSSIARVEMVTRVVFG